MLGESLSLSLLDIPTDRVVWMRHFLVDDLERVLAAAPADAPAVIVQRVERCESQSIMVASILDEMESVAAKFFPAWLPAAKNITTATGAALAAVRATAIAHAVDTSQYGPFLADLAVGALTRRTPFTRRHSPEIRARGLKRVLASSLGRPTCALLLHPPNDLDEQESLALVGCAQWLVDHGHLAVWICGELATGIDWLPDISTTLAVQASSEPEAVVSSSVSTNEPLGEKSRLRRNPSGNRRRRSVTGKPHPASRAEVTLETALADRGWAAGRAWNHTVRPGPLVNPVRVDLLWKRERCIVEIDGDDHRTSGKYADDRQRDVMLQLSGYAVLRFTNRQVAEDIENVLALLQQFLANRRRAEKET